MKQLEKGQRLKRIKTNPNEEFKNTMENAVEVFEVKRVNRRTYSMECVEGFMKGYSFRLCKGCAESFTDENGTTITWEEI